jgi:hypothetical protein
MKSLGFSIFLLLFFVSCTKKNKITVLEPSFYYWNSHDYLDLTSKTTLKNIGVKKLYIKYFEIDYSEAMGNFPFEKTNFNNHDFSSADSLSVIPTIYIKNSIFKFNNRESLDELAENIIFLIDKYNKERFGNLQNHTFNEIQLDCDWTKSTRDNYFYLLQKVKQLSNKKISCTLRLYPYKYPEIMGIPPVDSATLMCYNLIKPLEQKNKNSILDINELKSYLNTFRKYPIHLDIALPIFCWTQIYQNNQFQGLIDLNSKEIQSFTKAKSSMWYEVTKDTMIYANSRHYFRVGDQLKVEDISIETLHEAISVIKENVSLDNQTTVTLFNLNNATFKRYSNDQISSCFSTFTK